MTTTRRPVASVTDTTGLPDPDGLFGAFRDRSDAIAGCGSDVVLRDDAGDPLPDQADIAAGTDVHVSIVEGGTNVLRLTGEAPNNMSEITFGVAAAGQTGGATGSRSPVAGRAARNSTTAMRNSRHSASPTTTQPVGYDHSR
ncbi:hypothetical protein EDD95_4399 [Streptomyces sp. CEV 2-1]|nr:hypothetical protein EDD95_4399 [Streptomyces sp. CEV 2-1]